MTEPTPAHVKAHTTGRWAEIMFRALSTRIANRWRFVSFRGAMHGDSRGVVDVIAIRRNMSQLPGNTLKRGDLLDLVIVQVKGGAARGPTLDDVRRLRQVSRRYHARAIVLFHWRRSKDARFFKLGPKGDWQATTGAEIFG